MSALLAAQPLLANVRYADADAFIEKLRIICDQCENLMLVLEHQPQADAANAGRRLILDPVNACRQLSW